MYGSVCNEVLWYNKYRYIKTDKRTIFYKELADKQIFKVKHILNNDRKIMTFNELPKQFEIPSKFWFSWQKIVSCIPNSWRKILNRNIDVNQTDDLCIYINKKMYPIRSITNKVLYNKFVEQKLQKSRGSQKNSIKYNLHQDQWQTIFMRPHNLKVENKVKDLQYKIIHRCVTTNSMLYNMKIKAYNTCYWCHFQEETIEHLFVECHN